MAETNKKGPTILPAAVIVLIAVAAVAIWAISRKPAPEINTPAQQYVHEHVEYPAEPLQNETKPAQKPDAAAVEPTVVPPVGKSAAKPVYDGPSLREIVATAQSWQPIYAQWMGKASPNFALNDLAGKLHKLNDYKGKKVLLIFWATWCPPCRAEIPGLIELRNSFGEDKLAILAISDEKTSMLKDFAAKTGINYTVLLDRGNMPQPYGFQRAYRTVGVPCSFFVSAGGKIKLAAVGMLSLPEIKAVLQAKN